MADLIIKPATGDGNKLIIQDKGGTARITTGNAGVDIPAVTGNFSVAGNTTASGNVTVTGDIVPSSQFSNRNVIYNGGMQIYQRGS